MNKAVLTQRIRKEGLTDYLLEKFSDVYGLPFHYAHDIATQMCINKDRRVLDYYRSLSKESIPFDINQYFIYKEFRSNNKKDSISEEFYRAKYGSNWEDRRNERCAGVAGTLENLIKKYGEKEGTEIYHSSNDKKKISLDNLVKKYGEEVGTLKWEHFRERNSGNLTLERQVEIHGEIEGLKRYQEIRYKISNKNTLDYYKEIYGEIEGSRRYFHKNKKNSLSSKEHALTVEDGYFDNISLSYNISKYGEIEGTIRYNRWVENQRESCKRLAPVVREKMEAKGIWIPKDQLDEWTLYWKLCRKITADQDVSDLPNIDKRAHRGIDENAYELDHVISIKMGYEMGIPAEVIGHVSNLQVIHWKENACKSDQSYTILEDRFCTRLLSSRDL